MSLVSFSSMDLSGCSIPNTNASVVNVSRLVSVFGCKRKMRSWRVPFPHSPTGQVDGGVLHVAQGCWMNAISCLISNTNASAIGGYPVSCGIRKRGVRAGLRARGGSDAWSLLLR